MDCGEIQASTMIGHSRFDPDEENDGDEYNLHFNDRFWVYTGKNNLGFLLPEYNMDELRSHHKNSLTRKEYEKKVREARRDCIWVTCLCLGEILSLTEIIMADYSLVKSLFYVTHEGEPEAETKPKKIVFKQPTGQFTVYIDSLNENLVISGSTTVTLDSELQRRLDLFGIVTNESTRVTSFYADIWPSLRSDMEDFVTQAVRLQRALITVGHFSEPAKAQYEFLHEQDPNSFPERQ
jgi:hypothetical protein